MTAPDDQMPDNAAPGASAASGTTGGPELAGAAAQLLRGMLLNGRQGLVEGLAEIGYRLLNQARETKGTRSAALPSVAMAADVSGKGLHIPPAIPEADGPASLAEPERTPEPKPVTEPVRPVLSLPPNLIGPGSLLGGDFRHRAATVQPLRYPAGLIGPGGLWCGDFKRRALAVQPLRYPAGLIGPGSLWCGDFKRRALAVQPVRYPAGLIGPGSLWLPDFCRAALPAPRLVLPAQAGSLWVPEFADRVLPPGWQAPGVAPSPAPDPAPAPSEDDISADLQWWEMDDPLPAAGPSNLAAVPVPEPEPAAEPEKPSVESVPAPWPQAGISEADVLRQIADASFPGEAVPLPAGLSGPAAGEASPIPVASPQPAAPPELPVDYLSGSPVPPHIPLPDLPSAQPVSPDEEKASVAVLAPWAAEPPELPAPAAMQDQKPESGPFQESLDVAALFSSAPDPLPPEKSREAAEEELPAAESEPVAAENSGPLVLPPDFFAATAPLPPAIPRPEAPLQSAAADPLPAPSPLPAILPGNPFLTAPEMPLPPLVSGRDEASPVPVAAEIPPAPVAPLNAPAPEPISPQEVPSGPSAPAAPPDFSNLPGELVGTGLVPPLPETNLDPEQIWKLAAEELTPRPLSTPIPPWIDQPVLSASPALEPPPAREASPVIPSPAPHPMVTVGTAAPEPVVPMTVPVPSVAAAVRPAAGGIPVNPFAASAAAAAAQVPWLSAPAAQPSAPVPADPPRNPPPADTVRPTGNEATMPPAADDATVIPMTLWRDVPPTARPAKIVTRAVLPVEKSNPVRSVILLLAVIGGLLFAGWYFRAEIRGWLDRIINGNRRPRPARVQTEKPPANPTVMRALDDPAAPPVTSGPAIQPPGNATTAAAAPAVPAAPAASPAPAPDPAILAGMIDEARAVAERLLRASSADEIAPLVRDGEGMTERIAAWLSARSTIPAEEWTLEYDRIKSTPAAPEPACVFRVVTKGRPEGYSLMVEKTPQGWLVEWDLYAQCRDDSLNRFLTDPEAPAQPFFVHLQRSHYFGKEKLPPSEQSRLLVFKVLPPDARPLDEGGFVFVTRGTRLARFLEEKLPDSAWDQVISPMVELVRRNGRIEIQKVVRMTWRRPVKAEESVQ